MKLRIYIMIPVLIFILSFVGVRIAESIYDVWKNRDGICVVNEPLEYVAGYMRSNYIFYLNVKGISSVSGEECLEERRVTRCMYNDFMYGVK